MMTTDFDGEAIPLLLRAERQWVCWTEEQRGGKPTKAPVRREATRNEGADT